VAERLPVAVDAMGGDKAPAEIVAGAIRARDELGVPVVLVGRPEDLPDTGGLEVLPASEVIAMDADPAKSVRTMKDSSLVRAAEAVRDGKACAMVSAGNTGATMASALLRMKRLPGVGRPAIATPLPCPGSDTPTVLLDAGANAECTPEWLVQFAQMGATYVRQRYGIETPRVGLLSIGEEPTKGTPLVKDTHRLLAEGGWATACGGAFVGNVEGRDILTPEVDVVVTDGFTGNVVLKTLEGGMKSLVNAILGAFATSAETQAAGEVLFPALLPLYGQLDPNNTGGAMLLGVGGVCIISHGSSNETAIVNAVKVATEMVEGHLVEALAATIRPSSDGDPEGLGADAG
jgi:glycerol-3-phosphate acyltransferase PlsX